MGMGVGVGMGVGLGMGLGMGVEVGIGMGGSGVGVGVVVVVVVVCLRVVVVVRRRLRGRMPCARRTRLLLVGEFSFFPFSFFFCAGVCSSHWYELAESWPRLGGWFEEWLEWAVQRG